MYQYFDDHQSLILLATHERSFFRFCFCPLPWHETLAEVPIDNIVSQASLSIWWVGNVYSTIPCVHIRHEEERLIVGHQLSERELHNLNRTWHEYGWPNGFKNSHWIAYLRGRKPINVKTCLEEMLGHLIKVINKPLKEVFVLKDFPFKMVCHRSDGHGMCVWDGDALRKKIPPGERKSRWFMTFIQKPRKIWM